MVLDILYLKDIFNEVQIHFVQLTISPYSFNIKKLNFSSRFESLSGRVNNLEVFITSPDEYIQPKQTNYVWVFHTFIDLLHDTNIFLIGLNYAAKRRIFTKCLKKSSKNWGIIYLFFRDFLGTIPVFFIKNRNINQWNGKHGNSYVILVPQICPLTKTTVQKLC